MNANHKFLNEKDTAEMCGFSVQTLRNWRFNRRGIPYCKVGRRSVRYDIEDVLSFMNSNRINFDD